MPVEVNPAAAFLGPTQRVNFAEARVEPAHAMCHGRDSPRQLAIIVDPKGYATTYWLIYLGE